MVSSSQGGRAWRTNLGVILFLYKEESLENHLTQIKEDP